MERPLRLRLANTVILTGVLVLYVLYDAGFRFWMSQSDAGLLNAMILHDTKLFRAEGPSGFAFDAAQSSTGTPPLHRCLPDLPRCTKEQATKARLTHLGDTETSEPRPTRAQGGGGAHKRSFDAATSSTLDRDVPMAAVIVESSWLTADQRGVSISYAQRLIEGYRYALLTGAPWVLLAGSAEETSVGLQHLRLLSNPAEALFSDATLQRWPLDLVRLARPLRDSMMSYPTLGAWMHGVGTRSLVPFCTSSVPAHKEGNLFAEGHMRCVMDTADTTVPSAFSSSPTSTAAALQAALHHLLTASAMADAEDGLLHGRPDALVLAATWLRRHESGLSQHAHASGTASRRKKNTDAGDEDDPATVYAATQRENGADDGRFATAPPAQEAEDDAMFDSAHDSPMMYADESAANTISWACPRLRELYVNSTPPLVHTVVPGILTVAVTDPNRRARYAAKGLQHLLEKTLAHRQTMELGDDFDTATSTPAARPGPSSDEASWWWWLGKPYGVTVVAGGWEQQRAKLLYTKAFRDAAKDTQESLRRAVHEVHHARCQFEGPLPSPGCRAAGRTKLLTAALPFSSRAPEAPHVFVVPPPFDDLPVPEPKPEWLNYTGELPPTICPDASQAALVLGRVSYFLYFNYRRWMDWFLASLPGGSYQDHFVLMSVLMSDLADHRISWRDVLYLRP